MPTYYLLDGSDYKVVDLATIMRDEKLVLDSDLQTVKGSAETAQKRLQTELDESKKRADDLLVRATTAESASEEVKKQIETLKPISDRVPTLESELNALKEKHSAAETQLLTTRRNSLIEKYGLKDDAKTKVESMTAEQLTAAEEAANLFGSPQQNPSRPRQNIDRNPNNNNSNDWDSSSAHSDIVEGLKEIRVASAGSS